MLCHFFFRQTKLKYEKEKVEQSIHLTFGKYTAKNILGIAHPKHTILLLVSRKLEGNSGYFALLVASNQIYCLSEVIFSN